MEGACDQSVIAVNFEFCRDTEYHDFSHASDH